MAHRHGPSFTPAAGVDWLLPLYDPLTRWLGADAARRVLALQADLTPGHRVLDLGCGTGTFALELARLRPESQVVGIDPDPRALGRARAKAARAGLRVHLDRGSAAALPHPDACFDRVLSTFVLHHLNASEKTQALREALRVLVPGGWLHVLDFGAASERRDGWLARLLHRSEQLADHFGDGLSRLLQEAGFVDVREVAERWTPLGRVAYHAARRPPRRVPGA